MAINNKPTIQPRTVTGIFTNYIAKVLPLAFDESMSYYECLCALLDYINKTIVPAENTNAAAIAELQHIVETYLDDETLQPLINEKLDQMAEDGTLQEIIAEYLNANALWCFDNVQDMKEATNLIDGSFAKTLGYYAKNDGGSAIYKIRTITNNDVVNQKDILSLNDETLIAELVLQENIIVNQFGAYGDGIHDDTATIKYIIDKYKRADFITNKTYIVNELDITDYVNIYGNGATLKASENCDYIIKLTCINNEYNGIISNLTLDGDFKALDLMFSNASYRRDITNINFVNPRNGGSGFHLINGGGGTRLSNINGKSNPLIDTTFLKVEGPDLNVNMADYQNYHVGLYTRANLQINQFHGYIWGNDTTDISYFERSKFIHMDGGRLIANNVYPDTQQFWFYISNPGSYHITSGTGFHNSTVSDEIIALSELGYAYVVYNSTNVYSITRRFHLNNFAIQSELVNERIKFINQNENLIDVRGTDITPDSHINFNEYCSSSSGKIQRVGSFQNSTYYTHHLNLTLQNNGYGIYGYIEFNDTATLSDTNELDIFQLNDFYDFYSPSSYYQLFIGTDEANASGNTEVKLKLTNKKIVLEKLRATSLANKKVYLNGYIYVKNTK